MQNNRQRSEYIAQIINVPNLFSGRKLHWTKQGMSALDVYLGQGDKDIAEYFTLVFKNRNYSKTKELVELVDAVNTVKYNTKDPQEIVKNVATTPEHTPVVVSKKTVTVIPRPSDTDATFHQFISYVINDVLKKKVHVSSIAIHADKVTIFLK